MPHAKRRFRLRMRPGRAMVTFTTDPEREPASTAGAAEEVIVSEETAAFLIRQRAADIVEIIEPAESDQPAP
jgi:hypothetical protein